MRTEEYSTFSRLSQALWSSSQDARRMASEALIGASLQDLTEERAVEKAAQALLHRVRTEGRAGNGMKNASVLNDPFYRLAPEQRFVLVALHSGHWSYARLARLLGVDRGEVEKIAWSARLSLFSSAYPSGPVSFGPSCPEYDSLKPWTQKFMDEEFDSGEQRLFIQNHLMACAACRKALFQCKETFYLVDAKIREMQERQDPSIERSLKRLVGDAWQGKRASERTIVESLMIFARRADVRLVLGFFAFALVWKLFYRG